MNKFSAASPSPLTFDDVIFDLKSWHATLLSGARGSSAADLAKLEKVVHQPLPDIYRKFLSMFGEDSGDLKFRGCHGHYDMSLQAVLRKPMRRKSGPKVTPTPLEAGDWLLIGTSVGGCQDCGPLYLHTDPKTPVVAQSESLREMIILAPSLEAFLFNSVLEATKSTLFKAPLHIMRAGTPDEAGVWQTSLHDWLSESGFVAHVRWEGATGYELWLRADAVAVFFRNDTNKHTEITDGNEEPILAIYAASDEITKKLTFSLAKTRIPHMLQSAFPRFPPTYHLVFA